MFACCLALHGQKEQNNHIPVSQNGHWSYLKRKKAGVYSPHTHTSHTLVCKLKLFLIYLVIYAFILTHIYIYISNSLDKKKIEMKNRKLAIF